MRNLTTASSIQDCNHDHDHDQCKQQVANAGPANWPGLPGPAAGVGIDAGVSTLEGTPTNANVSIDNQQSNDANANVLTPRKNWAELVNEAEWFVSDLPMLGHNPKVAPIFLNFKCIAWEGYKIPLIKVAAAVGKVVSNSNVDGIQPMHSG